MTTIPITKFFHICPQCKRAWGHPDCTWTSPTISQKCTYCDNSERNKRVRAKFEEDCHILSDGVEGDGIW